jgi:hypothetical protein
LASIRITRRAEDAGLGVHEGAWNEPPVRMHPQEKETK